ncbi:MAG: hypothetical protein HYZ42_13820 [Bacteroidetes bacterium]|nr:hypothetical protein [Bacteroidota bacterium]
MVLEFEGEKYKLLCRNNPLAEWAILKDNQLVLAYGITTENKKVVVKITGLDKPSNYILDCLLWYLFLPIAMENSDDNLIFLLMATA